MNPASQARGTQGSPAASVHMPIGQSVQEPAAGPEVLFCGHSVQLGWSVPEANWLGGHGRQSKKGNAEALSVR